MPRTQHTQEEIARIAEEIYRREIRDKVMPQHKGKFLVQADRGKISKPSSIPATTER